MNREIKFRGKSKETGKWVYGYYEYDAYGGVHLINVTEIEPELNCYSVEVIPESVGQYTGKNDKNGVEIYEKDIIEIKNKVWDCDREKDVWKKEDVWIKCDSLMYTKAYFDLDAKDMWDNGYSYEDWRTDWEDNKNIKVIGNIIDNKELLNK